MVRELFAGKSKLLRSKGIVLNLSSTVSDMGKSVTHRAMIVKQWLSGKEYTEIARATNKRVDAVANYVDKFKRVVRLAKNNYEIKTIAFMVKLSPSLAEKYYDLSSDNGCGTSSERRAG